jgi:hypothetical protein
MLDSEGLSAHIGQCRQTAEMVDTRCAGAVHRIPSESGPQAANPQAAVLPPATLDNGQQLRQRLKNLLDALLRCCQIDADDESVDMELQIKMAEDASKLQSQVTVMYESLDLALSAVLMARDSRVQQTEKNRIYQQFVDTFKGTFSEFHELKKANAELLEQVHSSIHTHSSTLNSSTPIHPHPFTLTQAHLPSSIRVLCRSMAQTPQDPPRPVHRWLRDPPRQRRGKPLRRRRPEALPSSRPQGRCPQRLRNPLW